MISIVKITKNNYKNKTTKNTSIYEISFLHALNSILYRFIVSNIDVWLVFYRHTDICVRSMIKLYRSRKSNVHHNDLNLIVS